MPLYFLKTHAFGRVAVEDASDEVYDLRAQVDREVYLYLQDLVVGLVLIGVALEWSLAGAQLIAKHAQTPDVCFLIVELASHDFWRHVVQGSAEGLTFAGLWQKY